MKFEFKASAREFDLAAEQEILLRFVNGKNAARKKTCFLAATVLIAGLLFMTTVSKRPDDAFLVTVATLLLILAEHLRYELSYGNMGKLLKMLYRGRHPNQQIANRTLRLVLVDNVFHVYNEEREGMTWDCRKLYLANESDTIFALRSGWFLKQYLALPKNALVEGSVEEFREYINSRLPERKQVTYGKIPQELQLKLRETKKKLFGLRD